MKKVCYKGDGTKATAQKIREKLVSIGGRTEIWLTSCLGVNYYFINNSGVVDYSSQIPDGYTLESLEEEYPYEAWVWDDNYKNKQKRVVFGYNEKLCLPYLCYNSIENISDIKDSEMAVCVQWQHAEKRNIDKESIKEKIKEYTAEINKLTEKLNNL